MQQDQKPQDDSWTIHNITLDNQDFFRLEFRPRPRPLELWEPPDDNQLPSGLSQPLPFPLM